MKVLTMGHACVDITPALNSSPGLEPGILYTVGPLSMALGGAAVNTARKLHELGTDVRMALASGDDDLAPVYRELLERLGIPMHLVETPLSTSYTIVVQHGGHDRTFWQHEGFNAEFDPRDIDLAALRPELLHAGYPSLMPFWCRNVTALRDAFDAAKALGITTSLDLAHVADGSVASTVDWAAWFAHTLRATDILSPSWDDVASALGPRGEPTRDSLAAAAAELVAQGVAVVQLSAGRAGFLLRTADRDRLARGGAALGALSDQWADQELWFEAEAIERPATTVGAGDSLTAGLIHAIGLGLSPGEAGEFARRVAGAHLRQEPLP